MANIPQLLAPSLGNAGQDISGGIANFVTGIAKQKDATRQQALEDALLKVKMMEAQNKGLGTPKHIVSYNQAGHLVHGLQYNDGTIQLSDSPAPESQFLIPTEDQATHQLRVATRSRYDRGGSTPATNVPLPSGTAARETSVPATGTTETSQGPAQITTNRRTGAVRVLVGPDGQQVSPQGSEADVRRARDAFEMIQGQSEMQSALLRNPDAYGEVAQHVATINALTKVPIIGPELDAFIRETQSGMSREAAQYYSAMLHAAAAYVFSRGGATLTKQEIDAAFGSLAPKVGEDSQTTAMRERFWHGIVGVNIKGNPAWARYREAAKQFGYDDSLENLTPPPVTAPQTPGINPRFDPRGRR